MRVLDFDRYDLRLSLRSPMLRVHEGELLVAFDRYVAEMVRDGERVCAVADIHFLRFDAEVDYVAAAAATGSEFLVRVCREALDRGGNVREYVQRALPDALTDVFVLDGIRSLDPDADKPVLRGVFAQAIFSALSHGMDIVFIRADLEELPFWRDTLGARQVGEFIAASGAHRLPSFPKPIRPRVGRGGLPRLRVVEPRS